MEAKAVLYDKLSKGGTNREDDARYLVQFRKKTSDLPPSDSEDDVDRYPESEEDERHFSDEYEPPRNPDEEWFVEFEIIQLK